MTEVASRILIIDGDARSLQLMETLFKAEGYVTETATNGEDALKFIPGFQPDLILIDTMLPGIDGFQVTGRIKLDPATKTIPIIMVGTPDNRGSKIRALQMGAEEFLSKPIERTELWVRVRNLLRLREFSTFLLNHNRILEEQVAARTQELREAYRDTILTMVRAAEFKDEETGNHVQRISYYCRNMAEEMGLGDEFAEGIFYASPMHDIGKIAIPDAILLKPGGFTPEEWTIMKSHTTYGAKILEKGNSPYIRMGAEIALNHHERWDGGGYPNGLKGMEIPISARIMNIADIYDTLRAKRPYKPAFAHEKAMEIITVGDGRTMPGHFDPQVLAVFMGCAKRWHEIYDTNAD